MHVHHASATNCGRDERTRTSRRSAQRLAAHSGTAAAATLRPQRQAVCCSSIWCQGPRACAAACAAALGSARPGSGAMQPGQEDPELRQFDECAPPANSAQPLPPGWQKFLDANTGKYFYVNHELKARSWVDPRAAVLETEAASPPAAAGAPPLPGDAALPSPAVAAHMPSSRVAGDRVPVQVDSSQMPRVIVPKDAPPAVHAPMGGEHVPLPLPPEPAHLLEHLPGQMFSMNRDANAGGNSVAAFRSSHHGAVPAPLNSLDFSVQRASGASPVPLPLHERLDAAALGCELTLSAVPVAAATGAASALGSTMVVPKGSFAPPQAPQQVRRFEGVQARGRDGA